MKRLLIPLSLLLLLVQENSASGYWAEPPKGLSYYMKRLPAKSLAELMSSASDSSTTPTLSESELPKRTSGILKLVEEKTRQDAVAACDTLLAEIRRSPGVGNAALNLVHDLRDCLADTKTPDADALDYGGWRERIGAISGALPKAELFRVTEKLRTGKGRLLANYQYLHAARQYASYDREAGCGYDGFAKVVTDFPDHPRAETALFMMGRAAFNDSRTGWNEPINLERLKESEKAFLHYLEKYPEGRFIGDAYGWLGGIEVKRANYALAMSWYIKQLDVPDHPEITLTASRMVERVMAIVLASPDEAPLDEIAAHPEVAMGTVYWILHAPEANMHNGFYDHPDVVDKWRKHWLPRLAKAVEKNDKIWKDRGLSAWFAAIRAHAASNAGDQEKALSIIQENEEFLASSDDLSFIHAVALQRSGKADEAVTAFRKFQTSFPRSSLSEGAHFRLATALQEAGKSGEAVAILLQSKEEPTDEDTDYSQNYFERDPYPSDYAALPPAASALSPDLAAAAEDQVNQYVDALLQFAPVEELAALSERSLSSDVPESHREKIRISVLGRALSDGFPDIAANFSGEQEAPLARTISRLSTEVEKNPSADTFLRLGNAWRDARGRLTAPAMQLDREEIFEDAQSGAAEELRVSNANSIGYPESAKKRVLEMDELTHAVEAWEQAVSLAPKGSRVQAKAISEILEAYPKIAMATPFARKHAVDNDWNRRAEDYYQALMNDCADSPEAKAAALPTFAFAMEHDFGFDFAGGNVAAADPFADPGNADPEKADPFDQETVGWTEYPSGHSQPYMRHREFLYESLLDMPESNHAKSRETRDNYQDLLDELYQIDAGGDVFQLAFHLKHLRNRSRDLYSDWTMACIHYAIEDLAEMVSVKNPPPSETRVRFFEIRFHAINVMAWENRFDLQVVSPTFRNEGGPEVDRYVLDEIEAAIADPEMSSVKDRLECLRLYVIANMTLLLDVNENADPEADAGESVIGTRDYALVEKEAVRFLESYPKSSKREEVALLRMRAAYRARRPLLYSSAAEFPENPFIASRYIRKERVNQLPWDPRAVLEAIESYTEEFESPDYLGEVLDLKAALAFREGDWENCLAHSQAILEREDFIDLHRNALRRISNVFARIADREDRLTIMEAVRKSPFARRQLAAYAEATLESDWEMKPLTFLAPWVLETLEVPPEIAAIAESSRRARLRLVNQRYENPK